MNIAIDRIRPGENELRPSLWVDLSINDYESDMCQLNICGSLFSDDNTFLSIGEEIKDDRGVVSSCYRALYDCEVEVTNLGYKAHSVSTLMFPVDEKAFGYINDRRLRNENHDVILNFLIKVRLVEHNFDLTDDTVVTKNKNVSSGRKNLFKIGDFKQPISKTISSGDWINKFMESLGFGKVMVFELSEPSIKEIADFSSSIIDTPRFAKRLAATILSLRRMENFMKEGQWGQVVEQLRDIELLESGMKGDIKTLLNNTTNLPDDKCQAFTTALDNLFSVSSQFHHSVRKDEVTPVMNVNKEDADFVYMFMLAITQLLTKKIEILKRANT